MRATKETAKEALKVLRNGAGKIPDIDYNFLLLFIEAAKNRLPSEEAVERDRNRSRKPVAP